MESPLQKATHQLTRDHNQRLILRTIYDREQVSRADVARQTGLTRTTVSQVVGSLLDQKLVKEIGQGLSKGGKSPILLSVPSDARQLIGIDLGNDEFRGAVVNLRGEIRHSLSLPLEGRQGNDALQVAFALMDALQVRVTSPLLGIGVGVPGVIHPAQGSSVHWAVNLSWLDLPLRDLLQQHSGVPLYVANDSQVAALAESFFGKWKNTNLVVIKAERGIGAGIVLDNELWRGDGFGAGEIGHVTVLEDGPRCNCGHYGCLEALASTTAITQRAREAAARERSSALYRSGRKPEITFDDVVRAARAGDSVAVRIARETGHYLGIAIANLVGVLNIHHIVISGGLDGFGSVLLDEVRETMRTHCLGHLAATTQVEFSKLGKDIVILGASALLLNFELGINSLR